jgi:hypothetical protein
MRVMIRRILPVAALSLTLSISPALPVPDAGAQSPSPTPSDSPTELPSPEPTVVPTPLPSPTEEPEPIEPRVKVWLDHVELFSRAVISGTVRPRDIEASVTIKFRRNGKTIASREAKLRDGRYRLRLRVSAPGAYRARAIVDGRDVKRTVRTSRALKTSMPALSQGDRDGHVKRLEKRLRSLGYYLPRVDRRFGVETADALIAFNKVQRSTRVGYVTEATWRALADPRRPKPRYRAGFHFEIDQTRQVIFIVKKGKVRWILHTSTGAGNATRDGTFTVHRKLEGYSVGRLYYPSYFDGLRAFHGWPEVPTYNASHGCARVPMWAAKWLFGKVSLGDTVRIYH